MLRARASNAAVRQTHHSRLPVVAGPSRIRVPRARTVARFSVNAEPLVEQKERTALSNEPIPDVQGLVHSIESVGSRQHAHTLGQQLSTALDVPYRLRMSAAACNKRHSRWIDVSRMLGCGHVCLPSLVPTGCCFAVPQMSAVDGPGLRCVIFTQGCGMRCHFCSNPDTQAMNGNAKHISSQDLAKRLGRLVPYLKAGGGGVTCR